ncbi:MAG: DUF1743 domain-containing protein [Candidatus Bathyarchaeota archaeon]|nr:MAG: DUF1743 domain-containing protein [Candidatus Bathyarchaeota archaeon]
MKPMVTMHIGFDDTDSPRMGCTTYIAALLVVKLHQMGAFFVDYPNLIRLNPNVPWKTRGNGALCLRIRCNEEHTGEIMEATIDTIEKNSDSSCTNTNPGVVFLLNDIQNDLRVFAKRAIQGIVEMKEALKIVKTSGAEAVGIKNGRGIIGGLAAIGETLERDHTYEVITYRTLKNRGTPRRIHIPSVTEMNEKTSPLTFNNIDSETGRILIAPRGPDPILYGIRGESPEAVKQAHKIIRPQEPIERWVIFRTNHGTDAHLHQANSTSEIKPFNPVIVQGDLCKEPEVILGGHVIFRIKDEKGEVDCAAYEPTGALREVAKKLIVGDSIEAYGGVRPASSKHPVTVNLEKIRILKLAPKLSFSNPKCPHCDRRMKSMGKEKGFRCDKCGFRSSELEKVVGEHERTVRKGLYLTSQRSQRHLTKPLLRYGTEKAKTPKKMIVDWHFP